MFRGIGRGRLKATGRGWKHIRGIELEHKSPSHQTEDIFTKLWLTILMVPTYHQKF